MTPNNSKSEMSFLEHLQELRSCLGHSLAAVALGAVLCFVWADPLFAFLTGPLKAGFTDVMLIGTGPAEAFITKLKVSVISGLIVSCPYWFYQLWRFISPGLHEHERKLAAPFVAASTFFFLVGVSFCFYVVFPFAFQFFAAEFASIGVSPTIRIGEYLNFAVKLLLIFGIVFELPVATFFLARMGLVTSDWLLKQFRLAIVVVFVVAALLTPPDVITQVLLAIPLLLQYGLCILVARYIERERNETAG